jgi:pimeloyl-ACP methyl ester carboxylesterase
MIRVLAISLAVGAACGWAVAGGPADKRAKPVVWTTAPRPVMAAYPPAEVPDDRPVVWVVDGAGDLRGCSTSLRTANLSGGSPLELSVFAWSHGYGRLLMDQLDMTHARAQGARLAAKIRERRTREPGRRTVVVAHSAGSAVALAATESLPADGIDRLILLAPSVSSGYDVRPALAAAREGVDVFCSKKDWVALGFVVRVVGTTDKFWSGSAAGRHGFQVKGSAMAAEPDAAKLRQHFWTADVAWTGHTGGHHGVHAPAFVQTYLFPLIDGP